MNKSHLLLVAAASCFASLGTATVSQQDQRAPTVRPYQVSRLCTYDRVMVGPKGNEVAVWAGDAQQMLGLRRMLPPSTVIVGRMHNPGHANQDKFFVYAGAGLRLFPIRWSSNGDRLFVRVREPKQRILAVNPDGVADRREIALSAEWSLTDISAITHGNVDLLSAPSVVAEVKKIDGKDLIRGHATIGSTVELIGARRSDLGLVRVKPQKLIYTGIASGQTRLLTVFRDEADYPGGVSYLGVALKTSGDDYLPYQLPVVDLATGKVAGKFGPAQIRLQHTTGLGKAIEQVNRRVSAGGGKILDVSLSGHTVVAIVAYPNGTQTLTRVTPQGNAEKLICAKLAARVLPMQQRPEANTESPVVLPVQYRISSIDRRGRETNRNGLPIVFHYRMASNGPRDAVLYFHGGPGGSLADNLWSLPELRHIRLNRDIIAVEYSGSIGGSANLARRLAEHGMDALRQDVDSIAEWLERRGYRKIHLIGESFGSIPAMLALSRHRKLFSASFHIAPLLKLQDPQQWAIRGGGLHPVSADTQLTYELASFGGSEGRKRFADALRLAVVDAKLGQDDHLYFGGIDDMSNPDHLPSDTEAKVSVVPHASHVVLGARSEVWSDIEQHMK